MRAWLLLVLGLSINPVAAQAPEAEAQSHILSAFTSRADPRVLADSVSLGPALRAELGAETDGRRIYDALLERAAGKTLRARALPPAEAARYAALVGGNFADPLIALEAGDLVLLLQYATGQKHVAFVELLSAPAARVAAPKPPAVVAVPLPEAPKPPAVVAVPPPEAPKPAAAVAVPPRAVAAPVEKPAPPVTPVARPKPQPVAVQKPAPPAAAQKPRPRGECVIKPVMSEEDLWNCSAPAAPAAIERLGPPVAAQKPQPAAGLPAKLPGECVIKPVMSEDELRACGVRPR